MTGKSTHHAVHSAIDAIWNTNFNSAEEKLVMYFLTNRHPVGEKFLPTYMPVEQFTRSLQDIWTSFKDLQNGTQLSVVKLEKTLSSLKEQHFIKSSERPVFTKRNKNADLLPHETVYDITDKLFTETAGGSSMVKMKLSA